MPQDLDPYALLPRLEETLIPQASGEERPSAERAQASLEAWRRALPSGVLASPAAPALVDHILLTESFYDGNDLLKGLERRSDVLQDPFLLEVLLTSAVEEGRGRLRFPTHDALVQRYQESYLLFYSLYEGFLRVIFQEGYWWSSSFILLMPSEDRRKSFWEVLQGSTGHFFESLMHISHGEVLQERIGGPLAEAMRGEGDVWWRGEEEAHLALTALYFFYYGHRSLFEGHEGPFLDLCDNLLVEELLLRLLREEGVWKFLRFIKTLLPLKKGITVAGLALYVKDLPSFRAMPPSWWVPLLQEA